MSEKSPYKEMGVSPQQIRCPKRVEPKQRVMTRLEAKRLFSRKKKRVACTTCNGRAWYPAGFRVMQCYDCKGTGSRKWKSG